jgi:hypothetical protein
LVLLLFEQFLLVKLALKSDVEVLDLFDASLQLYDLVL